MEHRYRLMKKLYPEALQIHQEWFHGCVSSAGEGEVEDREQVLTFVLVEGCGGWGEKRTGSVPSQI